MRPGAGAADVVHLRRRSANCMDRSDLFNVTASWKTWYSVAKPARKRALHIIIRLPAALLPKCWKAALYKQTVWFTLISFVPTPCCETERNTAKLERWHRSPGVTICRCQRFLARRSRKYDLTKRIQNAAMRWLAGAGLQPTCGQAARFVCLDSRTAGEQGVVECACWRRLSVLAFPTAAG